MWKEFKEFALKGNVMDLAVGVIIGGAFQKIITSLVEDIIMPLVTIFTGKVDFSELVVTINNSPIKYGSFITAVINFLIIALSIFFAIKYVNRLDKRFEKIKEKELKKIEKLKAKGKFGRRAGDKELEEKLTKEPEPTTKECPYCFSEVNIHATRCPHCTSELDK